MTIKEDIQSLSPSALVELFVLDATSLPNGEVSYFHAGTNELSKPIVWQGNTYSPLPIEASGFDVSTQGTLPRPRMKVANVGGLFSAAVRENDDLVGCKIIRKQTFAKYLDIENWIYRSNTASGAIASAIILDASASDVDNQYNGAYIHLVSGAGAAQSRLITEYKGATKVATIEQPWQQNIFKYSNDLSNALWFKVRCNAAWDVTEQASKITVTEASDPFIYQNISTNPKGRTFTIAAEIKGIGSAIGKDVAFLIYRNAPAGDITLKLFTVTGDWQKFIYTKTFSDTDASMLVGRIDFPQTNPSLNDQCLIRNMHLFEGSEAEYVETTENPVFMPNNTTGFEIRHFNYDTAISDPNQHFPDDIWFIEQKISENKYIVEWELVSVFDLQGVMLPHRQIIQDSCPWKYRGAECGYTGTAYFDLNDQPTTQSNDFCAKHLSSCKLRFGSQPLPFGGFPGAVRFSE